MRTLQVISSAFRCTLEEQDDPIVWLATTLRNEGADLALLLRGNGVAYAVSGQDASGLCLAGGPQAHPPQVDRDLARLMAKGSLVYAVEEDMRERGLLPSDLVRGVRPVERAKVASLFGYYDQVWSW